MYKNKQILLTQRYDESVLVGWMVGYCFIFQSIDY